MADEVTLERVEGLAAKLSATDQRRLAEKILRDLAAQRAKQPLRSWKDIRGAAAHPLCGEDAQQWVTRSREEADEGRQDP
jgi:hypothetical protein